MTPLFLSPSLPQVDEEGGERGAEGLGGGGRGGGEEVIGTSGGTREMLNMKIISDRLVLDGRNVFESKTFLPKPRSYSATQMTWLGFSSTIVPNSYAAARKDGLSRESNPRQSVELHRLVGPLKDALPTELHGCG